MRQDFSDPDGGVFYRLNDTSTEKLHITQLLGRTELQEFLGSWKRIWWATTICWLAAGWKRWKRGRWLQCKCEQRLESCRERGQAM
jgi:hypothetical protein